MTVHRKKTHLLVAESEPSRIRKIDKGHNSIFEAATWEVRDFGIEAVNLSESGRRTLPAIKWKTKIACREREGWGSGLEGGGLKNKICGDEQPANVP